jgi:GR25 family glycosyltransferase involved in LPS biosynthesis
MSHKKAWQTLIDNNDPYAVVMEDDCEISDDFQKDLKNALDNVNVYDPLWDFIYLGCVGGCNVNKDYTMMQRLQILFATKLKNGERTSDYIYVPEAPVGLHCYLLTNSCARKLLKAMDLVSYHVDIEFLKAANKLDLHVYATKKQLGYQFTTASNSTLTESKFPVICNKLLDQITDNYNISYSYYFGTPIFELFYFPVNLYLLSLIILFICCPMLYLKSMTLLIIVYFVIELILNPSNYSIMMFWIVWLCLITSVKTTFNLSNKLTSSS